MIDHTQSHLEGMGYKERLKADYDSTRLSLLNKNA
jgi:hypothetical protein